MTKKEFAALGEQFLPHLPDVTVRSPLMMCLPLKGVLRGFCFERSGSDKSRFYLWVFFMPLCIPTQQVVFNLGRRLGGAGQRWNTDEPGLIEKLLFSIREEGLPFLKDLRTLRGAARLSQSIADTDKSLYAQQAGAYLLARSGEAREAVASLDKLLQLLSDKIPWQAEMASRARLLESLLLTDPEKANKQLESWETETMHNLGLDEFGEREV